MSGSATLTYKSELTVLETIDVGADLVAVNPRIQHQLKTEKELTGSSTGEPVSAPTSDEVSLSAGAATINLAAAPWFTPNGGTPVTRDLTGLKVRAFKFKAPATNTAGVVIKDGTSNGYLLFGDSSGQVTLLPGAEIQFIGGTGDNALAAIDSTHRTIDLTSSQSDAKLDFVIVTG